MSKPYSSTETFDSTGTGSTTWTKTQESIGFYVEVSGSFDPVNATLDVTLEGSPDGESWAVLDPDSDPFNITEADLETKGSNPALLTAYKSDHNNPIELLRVNVATLDPADATLTTTIFVGGSGSRGVRYNRNLDV